MFLPSCLLHIACVFHDLALGDALSSLLKCPAHAVEDGATTMCGLVEAYPVPLALLSNCSNQTTKE